MKKLIVLVLAIACVFGLFGCGNQLPERTKTIKTDLKTYYEMSDGTWECDGHVYKYRLEIKGTMPNAQASSTFVYLSNIKNISFEQAYKAAGVSSNTEDYFSVVEAVLVDSITENFDSGDETVTFCDKTFNKSDLSAETLEWLDWYNGLTEEEQSAVDYVPEDLGEATQIGGKETMSTQKTTTESITYEQITASEAKALMDSETDYIILDVRTEEEFNESHIEGAILIPDYEIGEKAEDVLTDKNQLILVYCRSGRRSKIAANELAEMGYTNIKEFGGIIDWPYETINR